MYLFVHLPLLTKQLYLSVRLPQLTVVNSEGRSQPFGLTGKAVTQRHGFDYHMRQLVS